MEEVLKIAKAKAVSDLNPVDRKLILKEAISEIVERNGGNTSVQKPSQFGKHNHAEWISHLKKGRFQLSFADWQDVIGQRKLIAEEYAHTVAETYEMPLNEVYTLFMSPEIFGESI